MNRMQKPLDENTTLRAPALVADRVGGSVLALDPSSPNWMMTDERGLAILRRLDGKTPLGAVVRGYAEDVRVEVHKAWLHVETFARDALAQGFVSTDGAVPQPYLGRSAYLRTDRLVEFWIQLNDFCNLACEHCLVSDRRFPSHLAAAHCVAETATELMALRMFTTEVVKRRATMSRIPLSTGGSRRSSGSPHTCSASAAESACRRRHAERCLT